MYRTDRAKYNYKKLDCVAIDWFVPETSGEHLIFSNGDIDSRVWMYDSSLQKIGENDDDGGNHNFRLTKYLTAGNVYYIVAGCFGYNYGSYNINSLIRVNVPDGDYHLRNVKSTHYLDIHGPQAQEYVHQWSYHRDSSEKWTFSMITQDHYTIQSGYGNKKYVGISSESVSSDNVKLFSSASTSTVWRIYTNHDAELYFEPMNALGKFMCVPNTSQGTELQLEWMGTSVSNRNKWKLECRSETTVEGQRWSNWCWATTARMFANHYTTVPDERDQVKAVLAVKGEIENERGSYLDIKSAINYYVSGNTSTNAFNYLISYIGVLPQDDVNQLIDDGNVMIYAKGLGIPDVDKTGHSVILLGYTTVYNNGMIEREYISYDPMPITKPDPWSFHVDHTEGREVQYSYLKMKQSIDGSYSIVWDGYLFPNNS